MKLSGVALLPANRERVWEFLTDPEKLGKCLPGGEQLEPVGPDRYKVAMKFGIAGISGKFSGAVELTEKVPPASLKLRVEGRGAPGFLKGEGMLELREKDGATEVRYDGEVHVGGLIASVGQRMIEAAAKRIAQQFFDAVSETIAQP